MLRPRRPGKLISFSSRFTVVESIQFFPRQFFAQRQFNIMHHCGVFMRDECESVTAS
jgi:hypothetical protein